MNKEELNRLIKTYFKGDLIIWLVVGLLSAFSIMAVYSSIGTLAYKYKAGNTEYYLIKHSLIILLGFVLMYFAHLPSYLLYAKISRIAILIAAPLLLLTLLKGTNLNEASRWITLPIVGITFQTSDFAKLALIMFLARALSKRQDKIRDFKTGFLPVLIPVLITCGLILPANFSTAAVLLTTCMILMVIGRVSFKYIASMMGIAVVAFILFLSVAYITGEKGRIDTWIKRVETFTGKTVDSDASYQTDQAKIAIATGSLAGVGPGNSVQRNFLPHPYSDFIFAIIIEEYGIIGGAIVVFLYLGLFWRSIRIAQKSPKAYATFLSIGIAFSLTFQAMINMAVAVNLFPVTGQPLPMISMGGTSIWFTSLGLGILLSVSREYYKEGGVETVEA